MKDKYDLLVRQIKEIDKLIDTVNPVYLSYEIKKLREQQKKEFKNIKKNGEQL